MSKRIILTGGGTGGHITPLIAVAHELKQLDPDTHITYIGERNAKYGELVANNPDFDEVKAIFAGKFRRYHGESWVTRVLDVKTLLLNVRDLFFFIFGTVQALLLVKQLQPDSILLKGGFVGVPIGLAAAFWKKHFITHDSDTVPGLANRLVARWASLHATGMPAEFYGYPKESIRHVGVLVSRDYEYITPEKQVTHKTRLGLPKDAQVVLVTGGSGGAMAINQAVRAVVTDLLTMFPDLYIVHQVGIGKGGVYDDYTHERLQVFELLQPMYAYTGASDVVVTRAGANTMAELGVQGKACIVVPNPLLTGGHQLKNAEVWQEKRAAVILNEADMLEDPSILLKQITDLLHQHEMRANLGSNLRELTITDAAHKLALILLDKDE